ncbi:hypothetical protein CNMCM6069_007907 [Aspergillus lentulus]|nr:hypothetical protein CNMCM6069_007907 [Aspergillus lentulus]
MTERNSSLNNSGELFLNLSGNFIERKRSNAGRELKPDPGYSTPAARLSIIKMEDGSKHLAIAEDGANPLKASDEIGRSFSAN